MPDIYTFTHYGYLIYEGENYMPRPYPRYRYRNCISCDAEIDISYDEYEELSCGCCFRCDGCISGEGELRNGSEFSSHRNGTIHPYSYKPRNYRPKGNYPTEVLLGVELEVGGSKYSIANRVAEVDPQEYTLYCKDDCSIYGAEIVSHPYTLNWVKEWRGYDTLLPQLQNDDCWTGGPDQCECGGDCEHEYGLHIHVSRNAFKQLRRRTTPPEEPAENETYEQRIGRELRAIQRAQREQQAINHQMIWLMFLERNADKLNGEDKLARRDSRRWGAFKQSSINELKAKSMDGAYFNEARYTAINCQNDKTYELRFFKSTIEAYEFYAALEFADASVEFTRNINADAVLRGRALEWPKFVDWLNEQKTDTDNGVVMRYSNLIAQINTRRLSN